MIVRMKGIYIETKQKIKQTHKVGIEYWIFTQLKYLESSHGIWFFTGDAGFRTVFHTSLDDLQAPAHIR